MIAKLITSIFTPIFTFIGLVVTAYAFLLSDMEARDEKVMTTLRIERSAQLGELKTEIRLIGSSVEKVDGKVDKLLERTK